MTEKEKLLAQLNQIHQELLKLESEKIEPGVIQALSDVAADIHEFVERQSHPASLSDRERHSFLVDQLKQFEVNHPATVRFLSQMTDFLAAIGI